MSFILMQGKKFKDKAHNQREAGAAGVPDIDLNLSDSDGGSAGKSEQNPLSWPKRPPEGAGDGFVTSIKGLFNSQRRKAKAFVLRTMRGEAENEIPGDWSESEAEFSPFARQLTITKAKKLIRRHTKKFRSRGPKGWQSFFHVKSILFSLLWSYCFPLGRTNVGCHSALSVVRKPAEPSINSFLIGLAFYDV